MHFELDGRPTRHGLRRRTLTRFAFAPGLPVAEVIWARYAGNLIALVAVLPAFRVVVWRTREGPLQVLRGLMMIAATGLMFLALSLMPMAETYAVNYLSPLLVAAMGAAWLGERVGLRRSLALVAGFIGVLVVVRPGSGLFGLAALAPLGAAAAFAVYQLVTRLLAREHVLVTMFYSALIGTVLTSLVLPFVWQAPRPAALALMLLMGALGLAGQLAMIKAFALGQASTISPYVYTQILFAAGFGFLVFGDRPDLSTWIGAGIIAASGTIPATPGIRTPWAGGMHRSWPVRPLSMRLKGLPTGRSMVVGRGWVPVATSSCWPQRSRLPGCAGRKSHR